MPPTPAPTPLRLGAEIDGRTTVLDLVSMPPIASLLLGACVWLRDAALAARVDQELAALHRMIDESLTHPGMGHLLEVSYFTNDLGAIAIPSGQMISALGVGVEPLDAMAEHLRRPELRARDPSVEGMQDRSYFLWISRGERGLVGHTLPSEFRRWFVDQAGAEARRRQLLASWWQALPHDPHQSIARAAYWAEVERERAQLLRDEASRREVTRLAAEMRALQDRANAIYRQYQDVQAAMARGNQFLGVLHAASALGGVLRSAMELRNLVCTSGEPVGGETIPAAADQPRTIELWQREVIETETMRHDIERRFTARLDELRDLDLRLGELFQRDGIPIPDRPPLP